MSTIFEQLQSAYATGGLDVALRAAADHFRSAQRYHELFEVLKMESRQQLNLPLAPDGDGQLSESQQRSLEEGLLAACREVGYALLDQGQIQDSWFYLRHLGENDKVLARLADVPVTEENMDALLGLLLHEGLDTERGYQLVLEHHGTCNAITTMQNALYGRPVSERQAAGRLLVAHVHAELTENVRAHIEREEGSAPEGGTLPALFEGREYLFAEGAYHMDTSHLSSTVQIAGVLEDAPSLQLAHDLTDYGRRLDESLQYPSEPPFEDTYRAYGQFFAAQLGQDVDAAVAFFQQRAEATDAYQEGTFAIEAYIDLLARLGRYQAAFDTSVSMLPPGIQTTGRAPSLFDLSAKLGDFDKYRSLCAERDDALGYLVSLAQ